MGKEKRIVTTPSLFEIDESFQDERFMKIRVCAMHSGVNENHSRFSVDTILEAKDTFKNIPILARVGKYTDDNGNTYLDYGSHDMHIEDDFFNPGEDKLIYDEMCVGVIPETNNFELVFDQETEKFYVHVDALLYRDYGNYVCDILKSRGGKTDVSMEILCDDISYEEGGILNVSKMMASGCTLLSAQTQPGMQGANATITFSSSENKRQEELLKIMQEIKFSLDNYIASHSADKENTARKEEAQMDNENKLEDPVVLENENDSMVQENQENQDNNSQVNQATNPVVENENQDNNDEQFVVESDSNSEDDRDNQEDQISQVNEAVEPEDNNEPEIQNESIQEDDSQQEEAVVNEAMQEDQKFTVSFELSHDDIRYALYNLIYNAYPDEDLDIIQVYDNRFVMNDWWKPGIYWAQDYTHDDKGVSLVGDRVQVFAEFITEAEKNALDLMRSTYASMEAELNNYRNAEAHAEKVEKVQNNDDYSLIKDVDEFKELMNKMDEYSLEDLSTKADLILAKYAKSTKMFSVNATTADEPNVVYTSHIINLSSSFENNTEEKKPYGGIFEDYFKRKNKRR